MTPSSKLIKTLMRGQVGNQLVHLPIRFPCFVPRPRRAINGDRMCHQMTIQHHHQISPEQFGKGEKCHLSPLHGEGMTEFKVTLLKALPKTIDHPVCGFPK